MRNVKKGEAARSAILSEVPTKHRKQIEVWEVDLDRYDSVISFVKRVKSDLDHLDGFIANAGIELSTFETSEGLERSLTINVVSTYLMVLELLPKLQETADMLGIDTRLTIVGSLIHYMAPNSQLDVSADAKILETLSDSKSASMAQRYSLSKLMMHQVFTKLVQHLPKSTGKSQVVVTIVNPGWCGTELSRNRDSSLPERMMFRLMGRTSEEGSRTLLHGVTASPDLHGTYLSECEAKSMSSCVRSEQGRLVSKRLWEEVCERVRHIDPAAVKCLD